MITSTSAVSSGGRIAFLMALFATGVGPRDAAGGDWQALAPLQIARQETGAARIGDFIYIVGGLLAGSPLQATPTVEVYGLRTKVWAFIAPLPVGVDHAAVASAGGRLFVCGGYSADFTPRNELWIYNPVGGAGEAGAPLPQARGAAWAAEHGGKIYLFGGTNLAGSPTRTTYVYDPALDQWSPRANMPTVREHLNAITVGDYLYVIGGRSGASTGANERYDPATDTWMTLAPMPTPRSALALGHVGGTIYAAGGEIPMLFSVNEAYNITTNTWSPATPMAVARHGVSAVSVGDWFIAPGGGTVQGLAPTTYVDRFVPEPGDVPDGGHPLTVVHLKPSMPNPFATFTTIPFSIPTSGFARLTIIDPAGRHVRTLRAEWFEKGEHAVTWDGHDDHGLPAVSGVYITRLESAGQAANRRVVLVRR